MAEWMDEARRRIGRAFDAAGLGPQEAPYRILGEWPGARVRAYHDPRGPSGPVVLIVAAPFKRAYIWDLLPAVSVVRRCLDRGLRVFLLEWSLPTEREDGFGLAEYADRLPMAAIERIEAETGSPAPILAGHSLGGTFATIFAALHPERVRGLILVDAPLAFGRYAGPLGRALAAIPHARVIRAWAGSPVPGSAINLLCTSAAPDAFQVQRFSDLAASSLEPQALAIHMRIERWTYDEFPVPGRLFEETLEQLYRRDSFLRGTLPVGERRTGIAGLRSHVIAVINPLGRVVPPNSILKGLDAARPRSCEVLEYEGDRGPMFQHLGPLVTPLAHRRLWPRILDWAEAVSRAETGK